MKALRKTAIIGILGAALLGVAACTPTNTSGNAVTLTRPADELRTMLIGTWYGKQPIDGGGTYEFVTTRQTNATYTVTFRATDAAGQRLTQTETGYWGASAEHFYTTFKAFVKNGESHPVNPMDTANYDIYKVLKFDGDVLEYEHLATGSVFTAKRVADGYKLR